MFFFVLSFIGDNNFQDGRFGLYFFRKKVLLSEYSTDYVSSSYNVFDKHIIIIYSQLCLYSQCIFIMFMCNFEGRFIRGLRPCVY